MASAKNSILLDRVACAGPGRGVIRASARTYGVSEEGPSDRMQLDLLLGAAKSISKLRSMEPSLVALVSASPKPCQRSMSATACCCIRVVMVAFSVALLSDKHGPLVASDANAV